MHKLILGTVQFGMVYGISNSSQTIISDKELFETLSFATTNGIQILDSAEGYGNALERIGKFHERSNSRFHVISKFTKTDSGQSINEKVHQNLQIANVSSLYAYMFHSYEGYKKEHHLLKPLANIKDKGLLKHVGVSIYNNDQLAELINDPLIDIVQLPLNLLDNFGQKGYLIKEAKAKGKIIHVRSVFLQGLFFKPYESYPEKIKPLISEIQKLESLSEKNNLALNELALQYPFMFPEIDGVVLGVENLAHLKENIQLIKRASIDQDLLIDINNRTVDNPQLLNPANWQ